LVELLYANEVLRQHLHEWLRFSKYLDERGSHLPDVSADTVHQYMVERTSGKSASRSRVLRASIRIFLETDEQGKFRRRVGSPAVTPAWFAPILAPYLQFVKIHRGLAPKTTRKYIQKLSAFALYLEGAGVKELGGIAPRHVREFYENAEGPARRSYGSTLRVFFRWAAVQGWLSGALRDAVPRPRQYRYVNLPDVLGQAEQDRILGAVDRSTPLGRRDYAVLLLAARYGLRPCDIRQLTLDDIHWRDGRIDLQQLKTGRQLVLPLLHDVADALSEYLRDGRPASKNRIIFLRHCAPFEPFAAENNLASIMGRSTASRPSRTKRTPRPVSVPPYAGDTAFGSRASTQGDRGRAGSPVNLDKVRIHPGRGGWIANCGYRRGRGDPMSTEKSGAAFISPLATQLGEFLAQKLAKITRRHQARFGYLINEGRV
jgi:integrase/recombinase XerD